jgi:hypothetical protein
VGFRHSFSRRIKPIGCARCSLITDGACRRLAKGAKWNASMLNRSPQEDDSPRPLLARIDRVAREINAFLFVLALGLAALDLTSLWAFGMADALPTMAQSNATGAVMPNKPVVPAGRTMAALAPSNPNASINGW